MSYKNSRCDARDMGYEYQSSCCTYCNDWDHTVEDCSILETRRRMEQLAQEEEEQKQKKQDESKVKCNAEKQEDKEKRD